MNKELSTQDINLVNGESTQEYDSQSIETTLDQGSERVRGIVSRVSAKEYVKYLEFKEYQEQNRVMLRAKIHARIDRVLQKAQSYVSGEQLVIGGVLKRKTNRGMFHQLQADVDDAMGNKEIREDMRVVYFESYNRDIYRDAQRLTKFTTQIKNFDLEIFSGTDRDTLLALNALMGFFSPDILDN